MRMPLHSQVAVGAAIILASCVSRTQAFAPNPPSFRPAAVSALTITSPSESASTVSRTPSPNSKARPLRPLSSTKEPVEKTKGNRREDDNGTANANANANDAGVDTTADAAKKDSFLSSLKQNAILAQQYEAKGATLDPSSPDINQPKPKPIKPQSTQDIMQDPYVKEFLSEELEQDEEQPDADEEDPTPDPVLQDADASLRLLSSELGVSKVVNRNSFSSGRGSALPVDVIFERLLDTAEDAALHFRRVPVEMGMEVLEERDIQHGKNPIVNVNLGDEAAAAAQTEDSAITVDTTQSLDTRPTVVVLGSGWGAHAFMKVVDTFKYKVIVVSPDNHFVFTPMLASAAVGTVEYRSMTEAVRSSNPLIEQYIEGRAVKVDVQNQVVQVQLNSLLEDVKRGMTAPAPIALKYDKLLVSVGVKVADRIVPGAFEYCLRLKTCNDARQLRTAVGEALEFASRPDVRGPAHAKERRRRCTFCIVGGGPTGVELAGELSDFLKDITQDKKGAYPHLVNDVNVMLLHGGPDLVPQFDESLRVHALQSLTKRKVDVRLNARVNEVKEDCIVLTDKNTGEKETIPVGLTSWCAGTAQRNFMQHLLTKLPEEAKGSGGRINVDRWLRPQTKLAKNFGSILVLGDAAACTETSTTEDLLPQTAQVAGQQGAYAARLMSRGYDLSVTPPVIPQEELEKEGKEKDPVTQWLQIRGLEVAPKFIFLNLGMLAYVGGGEALTQVQLGEVPVFSYAGSIAFVLWRSVYLVKQVAVRNRVLVTFDWIKSALFGRDITRL